jgi:hypothetical protein
MTTTTSMTTDTLAEKITHTVSQAVNATVATELAHALEATPDELTADGYTPRVDDIIVSNNGRNVSATWTYANGTTDDGKTIAIHLIISHDKDRKVYTATSRLVLRDGLMTRMIIAYDPESPYVPHKIAVQETGRYSRPAFVRFAADVLKTVTAGKSGGFLHNLALAPQLVNAGK